MVVDFWEESEPAAPNLGESLGEFSADFTHVFKRILAAGALLLLGAALLTLGIVLEVLAGGGLAHHMLIFGLFPLAASFGMLGRAVSARGLRVQVHADGLLESRGGRQTVLRWQDVNRVTQAASIKAGHLPFRAPLQLELASRHGRRLVFNEGLAGLEELTRLVHERTLTCMLPVALEAYEKDAIIGFGALSVSREGIRHGDRVVPWEAVGEVRVDGDHLVVSKGRAGGPHFRVPVGQVPNAHVLAALAERVPRRL
jgi:hypothetical protein